MSTEIKTSGFENSGEPNVSPSESDKSERTPEEMFALKLNRYLLSDPDRVGLGKARADKVSTKTLKERGFGAEEIQKMVQNGVVKFVDEGVLELEPEYANYSYEALRTNWERDHDYKDVFDDIRSIFLKQSNDGRDAVSFGTLFEAGVKPIDWRFVSSSEMYKEKFVRQADSFTKISYKITD